MLNKTQKAEAKHLIQELEGLRPRLEELEIRPYEYEVCTIARRPGCGLTASVSGFFAIVFTGLLICLCCGYIEFHPVLLGLVGTALVACVAIMFAMLLYGVSPDIPNYREISTIEDIERFSGILEDYRQALARHDEKLSSLQSLIAKFEQLRPIIEQELRGVMELHDCLSGTEYNIRLSTNDYCQPYSVTNERYGDLVLDIIAAQESKQQEDEAKAKAKAEREQKIRIFEANLTARNSEPHPKQAPPEDP